MTGENEEIYAKARQLRAAGVPLAEIEKYLQSKLGQPEPEEPKADFITKALGTAASLVRDIPGMEAVQSFASSRINGIPYDEARAQIRAAEDATPKALTVPARLAGAGVAAAAVPVANPIAQGAVFGGAGGLLDSDRALSLEDRLTQGAVDAAVGGVAGKVADVGTTLVRGATAKPIAASLEQRVADMGRADRANYGKAVREGLANAGKPVPLKVLEALDKPDVKPYADMVMGQRQFQNADAGTVVRETYKLMSQQQQGLARQLKEIGFDAAKQLEHDNILMAKQELADAADLLMPSFRPANVAHATAKAEQKALTKTAEGINRVATKAKVAPRNALRNSPQALEQRIAAMTPGEAEAGLEGGLGALNDNLRIRINPNPLTGFGLTEGYGLLPAAMKANRVSPFIESLEAKAGKTAGRKAARAGTQATTRWLEDLLREDQ